LLNVLLVEDNPADVRLIKMACADVFLECNLDLARDGEAALDFLYNRKGHGDAPRPHVIILDLNIPRVSGLQVLETIKGDPGLRSIPVVVFSTATSEAFVQRSYDLQASCYIQKPNDFEGFERVCKAMSEFWLHIVRLPGQHLDTSFV
jgi:two-component system, chemotaxis family, response regulator Rcp1